MADQREQDQRLKEFHSYYRQIIDHLSRQLTVLTQQFIEHRACSEAEIAALREEVRHNRRQQGPQFKVKYCVVVGAIILVVGLSIGYGFKPFPSPSTNSRNSIYDASWNTFAHTVCEAASGKWQDIGDRLGFDWQTLEDIRESGRGSKTYCRSSLEKYKDEKGDSPECRDDVIAACYASGIGGRLQDMIRKALEG